MSRAFKLPLFFAASSFLLGSIGYLILSEIMPSGRVFGSLYRMFLYHDAHSMQYIAVISLVYTIVATICAPRCSHLVGWRRSAAILCILAATVLLASIPGGVLWKIHDMQAGHFTTGVQFWSDLVWGASVGLQLGWLVIALSLPYNILGLAAGYMVTHAGLGIAAPRPAHGPSRPTGAL